MKFWIKQLFHPHTYVKVNFREALDGDVRYSMRQYQCTGCLKTKWVDGRFDPYDK